VERELDLSPILKVCCGRLASGRTCGKIIPGNAPRCAECYKVDNRRRARKQEAAGRTTAAWRRLKKQAKQAAGYRCQVCGTAEQPTPAGWLDVHLRSRLRSHADPSLTFADLLVTCKPCHGSYHVHEATAARRG